MSISTDSAGIGSMADGDVPDNGDFYAPGDARIPKVLDKIGRRRKKPCKCKKKKGCCKTESFEAAYRKILESTKPYPFRRDYTDMPMYDDALNSPKYFKEYKGISFNIVDMSPDEYIERTAKDIFHIPVEQVTGTRETHKVERYEYLMLKGVKFPMPVLSFHKDYESQEGLHRAMAAKNIGVEKIPVMIVKHDR